MRVEELNRIEKKINRIVRPYWWPPDLIVRQAASVLFAGILTRWCQMPRWFVEYAFKCLPGAAGSLGMGCIGFPSHPVWEMTTACNLKCIHCHTSGGEQQSDELNTAEAKGLLTELAGEKEFRMMAFTGGEPLMRLDFYELLAFSKALGFANTMATNATLIDDTIAQKLKRAGVVIVAVSLDGFTASTHDKIRGLPGAFDRAIEGMRALSRAGLLLHVNITAMDYNQNHLDRLMELVSTLNVGILLMYQLIPVGRGRAVRGAALDLRANERLIRFIAEVQHSAEAIMEPVAGPQYWPYLLRKARISHGMALRVVEKIFHGCSAGRGFVYIKPNGDVWPCPFIEMDCGNVRTEEFHAIWTTSPILKDLRLREYRLKGQCGACRYRRLCGGCRGRAWAYVGDYLAEDPSCFIHAHHEDGTDVG